MFGVNAAYEHRRSVLRRSRHYHVFGTGCQVSLSLLLGQEQTRRLYDVLGTYLVPLQVCGILLGGDADGVAVDDQLALLHVAADFALELTVHRVILQHVSQVIYRAEVVDTYNLELVSLRASSTENHTADTTEAVDTDFDSCHNTLNYLLIKPCVIFFTAQKYIL